MAERFKFSNTGLSIEGEKHILEDLVGVVRDGNEPSNAISDLIYAIEVEFGLNGVGRDGEEKDPTSGYERRIEKFLKRVDESMLAKNSVLSVGFDQLEDGRESVYVDVIYDSPSDDNDLPDVANLYESVATFDNVSLADDLRLRLEEKYGLQVVGGLKRWLAATIQDAEARKAEGATQASEQPVQGLGAESRV